MLKRVAMSAALSVASAASAGDLAVLKEIHIGGPGRWDYVAVDPASHNLYVTRSTHTQVIDPVSGKLVADIAGGQGLHGTAIVPSSGRAFVTDGRAAKLLVIDTKANTLLGTIDAADDADGTIYDSGTDRVLVSCGDANQMLVLDPHADLASAKVDKIDLGGKPEFLAADGQGRAFVCLNDKNVVAVVDIKAQKVTARWPLGTGTSPAGLALDVENGHLFVGCHNDKAIVMSTTDGKVLAEPPIGHGNDACLFDPGTGHAFASGGDGTLTVIGESSPGAFTALQTLRTKPGSRTAGLDSATHTVYVPAVEQMPAGDGKRPTAKPDSFSILVMRAADNVK